MKYENVVLGKFIDRPNRFIAHVKIGDKLETVHVKNTGRCKELLIPGVEIGLQEAKDATRKTQYDLISVKKDKLGWVNIDSQVPNKVVYEWLKSKNCYTYIKPEYTFGQSRIDFYMEDDMHKYLMEVKGCTLEINGQGYFPDAPSDRAVKHLHELVKAADEGFNASLTFVIAMNHISSVLPNLDTHPAFGEALEMAKEHGVKVNFLKCKVSMDEIDYFDS